MHTDLPDDLAHPRNSRASLIANVVVGLTLLAIVIALVCFYVFTQS